jgi:NAD(P)H-hydrate epimerase
MATAGSGDILSGVLASLLAWSSEDPLLTVAAGALVTGVAGEIASNNIGSISMIASDTVSALPTAIRSLFQT